MWNMFRQVLARVLGDHHASHAGAALEMKGMDARELNDLGIGASEVGYVLRGGNQERRLYRGNARPRDCSSRALSGPAKLSACGEAGR